MNILDDMGVSKLSAKVFLKVNSLSPQVNHVDILSMIFYVHSKSYFFECTLKETTVILPLCTKDLLCRRHVEATPVQFPQPVFVFRQEVHQ